MGGGSGFARLVLGWGLTLRQADGCAGSSSRDCGLGGRSRSLHVSLGIAGSPWTLSPRGDTEDIR